MQFAQLCDRVEVDPAQVRFIEPQDLVGTWVNSNPDTAGVARMVISDDEGKLSIRSFAVAQGDLVDWGTADLTLFASLPSAQVPAGFTCRYDFGFAEIVFQAMIMKGLIVLAQFHTFKDDSKRSPFFVREYFALEHGRR
jgi:hypothetical protein